MANGKPWTIAELSRLAKANGGPSYLSISHATYKLVREGKIEAVAGAARAVGDGIFWKEKFQPTMQQGAIARAYRIVPA